MTTEPKTRDSAADEQSFSALPTSRNRSLIASVGRTIAASYNPAPIALPAVDPQLCTLGAIPRVAEVFRYSLAKLEYSLSSGGGLRAWFKLNILVAIMIAIPVILVMPAVTLMLYTLSTWTDFLARAAANIFWATLYIIATATLITGVLLAIRALTARRRKAMR